MKRICAVVLAAGIMLSVSACEGSTNSIAPAESESTVAESSVAADAVMYNFYRNLSEGLKNGEIEAYDGYFTDSAMKFLAEHDALFEKNEPLSDADSAYLATDFDLRDVEKNPDLHSSMLFNGTGTITDIQEQMLDDGTCVSEGIILYDGAAAAAEYCYFLCYGSVSLYAGDAVQFTALPLGVGNVDMLSNTKQRCVYIACTYLQGADGAQQADSSVSNEGLLEDDTGGTVVNFDENDADGLNPISYDDRVISDVYGTVWPGWKNNDPAYPDYADLSYGTVLDYLFEDSTWYNWSYDEASNRVELDGTYTSFDYTMGGADDPTACDVHLTFTADSAGNWSISGFRGDEFKTADDFMLNAYNYYYQANC